MKQLSLGETLRPLCLFANILGMTPFVRNKEGTAYVLSKLHLLQTLFFLTTITVLTVLHFDIFTSVINLQDFAKAGTIKILFVFRCVSNAFIMAVIFAFSYVTTVKLAKKVAEIHEIDLELSRKGHQEDIFNANYQVWRWSMILIAFIDLFLNVIGELVSQLILVPSYRVIDIFIYLYPLLIINTMKILFYVFSMILQKRFEIINGLIASKAEESQSKRKYPMDSLRFSEYIRNVVSLHKILIKISKDINEIFTFQLLLCITTDFILLIGDLHTAMYAIFFNLFSKHSNLVIFLLRNCCLYLFDLYYLAKKSIDLCQEANRTKIELLGIKIDIDKEEARNAVIASTLKLMQNKLEISACKLFNIDNALLFSICAAASSYLFIMLQLDMGDNNDQLGASNSSRISAENATVF